MSLNRALTAAVLSTVSLLGCADDADPDPGETKGPAANLKCQSSGMNAWDTYGVGAFVAVNEEIFSRVGAEVTANGTANLGDSFGKVGSGTPSSTADNAATFKGKLAAFLVYVYGGPSSIKYTDNLTYQGPQNMTTAHVGLNITSAQYDYFLTNVVVPALIAKGVMHGTGGAASPDDVSSCFAPPLLDAAFKASIVGK